MTDWRNQVFAHPCDSMPEIPDASVHCVVTSPPYYGLRDYGVKEQLGLEDSVEEYIDRLVVIFGELRRVLRPDGSVWLNLGDSFVASPRGNAVGDYSPSSLTNPQRQDRMSRGSRKTPAGLKQKDAMLIPHRVAIALQEAGWWVRCDIVWDKPNPMPDSTEDRPTRSHEYIFLLTKKARYFYDADAVAEPLTSGASDLRKKVEQRERLGGKTLTADDPNYKANAATNIGQKRGVGGNGGMRNRRSVWRVATTPYPGAHFATFPIDIPSLCIRAGSSEGGCCSKCGAPRIRQVEVTRAERDDSGRTHSLEEHRQGKSPVPERGWESERKTIGFEASCECEAPTTPCVILDPFMGSGTTAEAAQALGRDWVGYELNRDYLPLIIERTSQRGLFAS